MINFISFFYLYFLVIFSLLLLFISLFNILLSILFTRKNKRFELINLEDKKPLVSVLIPARNEENNINRCVNSLLEQSYSNIEVIILDDDSSDNTYSISNELSKSDSRVNVIKGKEIPKGWLGKNWACHQLSQKATGDFLLFIDSDTKLKPDLIFDSIKIHINEDLDLLTLFPNRRTSTFIDKIISVTIGWMIFSWIPIFLANTSKLPFLSAAFGQFLFFKKDSYMLIGGHQTIKLEILDDFELGRNISRNKLKLKMMNGVKGIDTFSYNTEKEALKGFSRAIFPFFYQSLIGFLILLFLFFSMTFIPFLIIFVEFFDITLDETKKSLIFLTWFLLSSSWILAALRSKQSILLAVLFPFAMLITSIVGFYSVISFFFEDIHWKNRNVIFQKENKEK